MEPFRGFHDLICTIPGISALTADVVVAETGADMSRFPTAKHLASWAGTTPGNNESAGRVKSTRTRPGNPYLQGALGASAMSIARTPGTYINAKHRRIATRRGPQKANVAIQHALLVSIWNMGVTESVPTPRSLGRGRGLPMMGVLTLPIGKTSTCLTLPSLALT